MVGDHKSAKNYFNAAEDKWSDATYEEIYSKLNSSYPNEIDAIMGKPYCSFKEIIVNDAPSGTGLIFIAVAEAVVNIPGSFILSIIFFFMVILLGLGSMVGTFEGVITPVYDQFKDSKISKVIPKQGLFPYPVGEKSGLGGNVKLYHIIYMC